MRPITEVKFTDSQQAFIDGLNERERKAFEIAKEWHENKVTRVAFFCYGYLASEISHVVDIAMRCETENERIVALLHEVVGQNKMTIDELKEQFSNIHVIAALRHLENDPLFKKLSYYNKVKRNKIATKIKIYDLEYLQEHAGGGFLMGYLTEFSPCVRYRLNFLRSESNKIQDFDSNI